MPTAELGDAVAAGKRNNSAALLLPLLLLLLLLLVRRVPRCRVLRRATSERPPVDARDTPRLPRTWDPSQEVLALAE